MKEVLKCPFSAGITVRFRCGATVRFPQESPSVFLARGCPLSARIPVRFAQELLSVFGKKVCPFSTGMSVRFGQEYAEKALADNTLYDTIVKHRYNFTRIGGVDYNLHQPQSIDFLPSEKLLPAWKADYEKMREQMIHVDSPKFEDLIKSLVKLKEKINDVDWKMAAEFPSVSKQE